MYNVLAWIPYFPTEIDISEENYKTLICDKWNKSIWISKMIDLIDFNCFIWSKFLHVHKIDIFFFNIFITIR